MNNKQLLRAGLFIAATAIAAVPMQAVPSVSATLDDGTPAATRKLPGDTIDYTVVINNAAGATTATGVTFTEATPGQTTMVAGSVNVSPLARDDAYTAVGNTLLRVGGSAGAGPEKFVSGQSVLDNDTEFLSDTFTLTSTGTFSSTQGGTVTLASNGTFTYLPAAGFNGTDTFTYTIRDDGTDSVAGNGDDLTGTGTVSIAVSELIWYVDGSAAGGGTGRSNAPFQSLAPINTGGASDGLDNANDYIFVYSGTYSGGFALETGQRLFGQPAGLSVGGVTIAAGGTRPALSHNTTSTLALSSNNDIRSMDFSNSAGNGISGSAVGTLALADFDVTVNGGAALSVTTSGTVTATGSNNDLNSTNGTALNVQNVNIGAAGLTFKSITAGAGAGNGITLDTTGATAGLTVTGSGTAGSGGTISGKTGGDGSTTSGIGIYLNNTRSISLTRMSINGNQNHGIRGTSVVGFTLDNSTVGNTSTNGTSDTADQDPTTLLGGECSIRFKDLTGTATISNCTLDRGLSRTLFITTGSGTLNLNISNSTVNQSLTSNTIGSSASDAVFVDGIGTATVNATVTNSNFLAYRQFAFQGRALNTATMNYTISGSKFANSNAANVSASASLNLGGSGLSGGDVLITYDIHDNTFRHGADASGTAPSNAGAALISGLVSGTGTCYGKFYNNTVGVSGVAFSGAGNAADALRLFASGNNGSRGGTRYLVQNNTIQRYGEVGIQFNARQGNATIDATVLGNTIREPGAAAQGAFGAIWVNSGALPVDSNTVNIAIGGTNAAHKNTMQDSDPSNATDVFLDNNSDGGAPTFINLYRNGSAAGGSGETLIRNILVDDNNATLDLLAGFTNGSTIGVANGLPAQPPLLAADGGVEKEVIALATTSSPTDATAEIVASPTHAQTTPAITHPLAQDELDAVVAAALTRWEAAGLTAGQLERLRRLAFTVENLSDIHLGEALGDTIRVDADAGGHGWFVDATPMDDAEFNRNISGTRRYTDPSGAPAGRMDLLTAILHEMGHALGLGDSYMTNNRDALMYGFLTMGERRLPENRDALAALAFGSSGVELAEHGHFLDAPITIGDLPAGKSLTIVFKVTINSGTLATQISAQGTVSGTNFSNVSTDDLPQPGGAADPTITVVEQRPTVSNISPSVNEDAILTFSAAAFDAGYSDLNGDTQATVRVTSLPSQGVLKLGGSAFAAPTDIARASLGSLTYEPNANYNGADSFGWNGSDGTLFATTGALVNITINAVNDEPTLNAIVDPAAILEDAAEQTVNLAGISEGPANESAQTLTITATSNNTGVIPNPTVTFTEGNATGSLNYTPVAEASGTAIITVTVTDSGDTANGGHNSIVRTFSVVVQSVNDAPVAVDDTLSAVDQDSGERAISFSSLTGNDSKGAANESGQSLTITAVSGSVGGTATLDTPNSQVLFTPTAGFNGTAGFDYTARDNGQSNGVDDFKSDTGHVSFEVNVVERFSIGNRVWDDTNDDGVLGAGEPGIPGVLLRLFADTDNNGVPDNPAAPVASDTTDANGYYLFDDLPGGRFVVRVEPENFSDSGPGALYGYTSSIGNDVSANDGRDRGHDAASPATSGILSGSILLASHALPTGESDLSNNAADGPPGYRGTHDEADDGSDLTQDFGFFIPLSVGNRVWLDNGAGGGTADDGIQNGSEPGIAGVAVELYRDDGSTEPDSGDTLVTTATTDSNGFYLFSALTEGDYFLRIAPANFSTGQPLHGMLSSTSDHQTAGVDHDDNGIDDGAVQANGIYSGIVTLEAGTEPTGELPVSGNPADGPDGRGINGELDADSDLTFDFGFLPDLNAPETSIDTAPANPTSSTSAVFTFSGTDDVTPAGSLTFETKLDGGGFSPQVSPQNFIGLSNGPHTFQVRAIDGAGNADASPASYSWTIDTSAPTVAINQAAGQADPTSSSPINFTVVFSKPVSDFDDAADVTLGGSAGPTTVVITEVSPNDGTTYNVAVSGMAASGTVTATVVAGAAVDNASNGNTASTSADNTVTFGGVPQINSSLTAGGTYGASFSYQITATNAPTGFGAAGLPGGLSVDSGTGAITGVPTVTGIFNATITASNALGSDDETLQITVDRALLTVRADDKTRPFGAANPALTATITGFVPGDDQSVVSGAPALATPATAASFPGAYPITVAQGTLSASNYTFGFANGTLTVEGGTVVRVNAGGPAYVDGSGNLWDADNGFNTGATFSTGSDIFGTADDTLYRTERYDGSSLPELRYSFNLPNGSYTVRLHFAEIYTGTSAVGARVFDVSIENQLVLDNFDIFALVGANAALVRSFPVSVGDGQLNIDLAHVTENPKIAAIEVIALAVGPDSQPPSTPGNLIAVGLSPTSIGLSWTLSTDNFGVENYLVFRDGVFVAEVASLSYLDTNRTPSTLYSYEVIAEDAAGNTSPPATVSVTTPPSGGGIAVVRVNAGGGAFVDSNGNSWAADSGFNTGSTFATASAIDDTVDDQLYQTERWDAGSAPELLYTFPVPNGIYTVKLHFAEIYSGAWRIGGRVFDVRVENQLVLDDFDIFKLVGPNAALVQVIPTTVTDGQLTIEFLHGTENPKISGIEVLTDGVPDTTPPTPPGNLQGIAVSPTSVALNWTAAGDDVAVTNYVIFRDAAMIADIPGLSYTDTVLTPSTSYIYDVLAEDGSGNASAPASVTVVTPTADEAVLRVNAGGGAYVDSAGRSWAADTGFNVGGVFSTTTGIVGTLDDTLYQSERYGRETGPELQYAFTLPNGNYTVRLHFAEIYAGTSAAGARVFDVFLENQLVLDNFDIFAAVGGNAALVRSFPVNVSDGQLNIGFVHGIQNPKIAAIEVLHVVP